MITRLKKELIYLGSASVIIITALVVFAISYQALDALFGGILWTGLYILTLYLVLNRLNAHLNRTMLGRPE